MAVWEMTNFEKLVKLYNSWNFIEFPENLNKLQIALIISLDNAEDNWNAEQWLDNVLEQCTF